VAAGFTIPRVSETFSAPALQLAVYATAGLFSGIVLALVGHFIMGLRDSDDHRREDAL
jgi:hypothetical protein